MFTLKEFTASVAGELQGVAGMQADEQAEEEHPETPKEQRENLIQYLTTQYESIKASRKTIEELDERHEALKTNKGLSEEAEAAAFLQYTMRRGLDQISEYHHTTMLLKVVMAQEMPRDGNTYINAMGKVVKMEADHLYSDATNKLAEKNFFLLNDDFMGTDDMTREDKMEVDNGYSGTGRAELAKRDFAINNRRIKRGHEIVAGSFMEGKASCSLRAQSS